MAVSRSECGCNAVSLWRSRGASAAATRSHCGGLAERVRLQRGLMIVVANPKNELSLIVSQKTFARGLIYEDTSSATSSNQIELNDEQIDTLIGTDESDIFSLGNIQDPLYNQNGDKDYALIQGFDVTEDIIELHGEESDYFLSPSSRDLGNGTSIFLKTDQGHDLLGIVENVNSLSFENYADNFAFV